ncbi:MAG: 2Fe-2S iron-sulfur cluster-binding protein, partial [Isosphaeraceae bacterium]
MSMTNKPAGDNDTIRSLTLQVKRYDPEKDREPHWKEYKVQAHPMDRVLDVVMKVKWEQDDTLGLRKSCAHGICGS